MLDRKSPAESTSTEASAAAAGKDKPTSTKETVASPPKKKTTAAIPKSNTSLLPPEQHAPRLSMRWKKKLSALQIDGIELSMEVEWHEKLDIEQVREWKALLLLTMTEKCEEVTTDLHIWLDTELLDAWAATMSDHLVLHSALLSRWPSHKPPLPDTTMTRRIIFMGRDTGDWHVTEMEDLSKIPPELQSVAFADYTPEWTLTIFGIAYTDDMADPVETTTGTGDQADNAENADPSTTTGGISSKSPNEESGDFKIADKEIVRANHPSFDLREALKKLKYGSRQVKLRVILGIHQRFWHSTIKDTEKFLRKGNVDAATLALIPEAIRRCPDCNPFSREPHKPTLRIEMSGFFNDIVLGDLFFLWDKIWLLLLDDATRFKQVGMLENKEGRTILRCMLKIWMKIFGPFQESGLRPGRSDTVVKVGTRIRTILNTTTSEGHR